MYKIIIISFKLWFSLNINKYICTNNNLNEISGNFLETLLNTEKFRRLIKYHKLYHIFLVNRFLLIFTQICSLLIIMVIFSQIFYWKCKLCFSSWIIEVLFYFRWFIPKSFILWLSHFYLTKIVIKLKYLNKAIQLIYKISY